MNDKVFELCAQACTSCDATRDEVYAGNTELILPYCVLVLDDGKCHSINTITPHTENVQIYLISATLLTTLLNIISLLLAKYLRVNAEALQTESISIIISL